jgi:exopolysaccharide biosynthesis polyprenyl glycosylphosphotransferase
MGSGAGSAVDIEQQQMSAITQPRPAISPAPAWPAPQARPVMPRLSVEERLRRRRVHVLVTRLLLLLLDAVMLNVAFVAAWYIRFVLLRGVGFAGRFVNEPFSSFRTLEVAATCGTLALFGVRGLYRLRPSGTWFKQVWIIVTATTMAFALFSAYDYVLRSTDIMVGSTRSVVTFLWLAIIVLVSFARLIVSVAQTALYRFGIGLANVLVVGAGNLGKLAMQQIADSPYLGYRVVGFIHDHDGPPADFGRFKVLGTMRDVDAVIRAHRVAEVIIALPSHQHDLIMGTVRRCERAGANFKLIPSTYEMSLSRIHLDEIEGIPLIGLRRSVTTEWERTIKRVIDVVGAGAVLVIGAPVWLLVALAIKLDSPGPVLYRQVRVGYRGELFNIIKFRSMYLNGDQILASARPKSGNLTTDKVYKEKNDPRVTRVGRFIRKTSLDEIPQFINVLKGDMSLVGPRPLQPVEREANEDWWQATHVEMRPGLTGLWQTRGRSTITFDERILMDLYYIESWSLWLDVRILLRTIPALLFSRGAF